MHLALAAIAFAASCVNGAIGYGFSSVTVPLALLLVTNRVLNPALVPITVALNAWVLWVNRAGVPAVGRRVAPVIAGLLPGVAAGTLLIARLDPDWLKLGTFVVLLPLVLTQAAGWRRPIRAERAGGVAVGGGVGALYAVTTISGPPLALLLNNQGLAKEEFRAALGLIRLAESSLTALAYAWAGLYSAESLGLIPAILPGLLLGVPAGAWAMRRVDREAFRRVCMSFDTLIVAYGLSTLLYHLRLAPAAAAYGVLASVAAANALLLHRFFAGRRAAAARFPEPYPGQG
jgi:uncharacterized membrane protein YfcA